jgi:polyhydroxybutyrate depolymerase
MKIAASVLCLIAGACVGNSELVWPLPQQESVQTTAFNTCSALPPNPTLVRHRVDLVVQTKLGPQNRYFLLMPPANYDHTKKSPVLTVWHSLGSSATGKMNSMDVASPSYPRDWFWVVPQGTNLGAPLGNGWQISIDPAQDFDTEVEGAFYNAIRKYMGDTYCIDQNRVVAEGFSFGGLMSNYLGCYKGGEIRAIVPGAGGWPADPDPFPCPGGPVAAFIHHGINDNHWSGVVAYPAGVHSKEYWRVSNGCSTAYTQPVSGFHSSCVEYQDCLSDKPLVWCAHNGAHTGVPSYGLALRTFLQRFQ